MNVNELAQLIDPEGRPRGRGNRLNVRCPAHNDKNPSLTIWIDNNGKAALNCHAGCDHKSILEALPPHVQQQLESTWKTNVTVLLPRRRHTPTPPTEPGPQIEAEYPYHTERETLAYLIRRFPGKKIRPYRS